MIFILLLVGLGGFMAMLNYKIRSKKKNKYRNDRYRGALPPPLVADHLPPPHSYHPHAGGVPYYQTPPYPSQMRGPHPQGPPTMQPVYHRVKRRHSSDSE
eukprot:Lankesteria_metandrocarpae@DN3322_c0_g1_i3.p1